MAFNQISSNCYSFRQDKSSIDALRDVLKIQNLNELCCLKIDVSNYFNSIPAVQLCEKLNIIINDDEQLLSFLKKLLLKNQAIENGRIIEENRGAMAGTPISPFFANIYLNELDNHYKELNIPYFRYSDDILVFLPTTQECEKEFVFIRDYLKSVGLSINERKYNISDKGEPFEFLGFQYDNGTIDISSVQKEKVKAKIKRKAKALYRWRCRKDVNFDSTAKCFIRVFNNKFYNETDMNLFSWSGWFLPIINTSKSLKEIDEYMVQYIRYLSSGRHYKGNYKITYEKIKELGFRSLVNEYYKSKSIQETYN